MKFTLSRIRELCVHYTDRALFKYYRGKLASKGRGTSMSDDNAYPAVCYMASRNEYAFRKFRRNSTYNDILEHVSGQQGQEYLDVIRRNGQLKFSDGEWEDFRRNDLYGNPVVFPYEINGRIMEFSPTTLRYAKVLQDIAVLFDEKRIRSVAEIGIGYAGQCRILTGFFKGIEKYSLFDLPEVLGLAERYLGKFGKGTATGIRFIDGTRMDEACTDGNYDLVISNYAFSELIRSIQDSYLDKVILKSGAGYITWNSLSCDKLDGYSLEELLEKIPGSKVIAEEPLTKEKNCIIVWGTR